MLASLLMMASSAQAAEPVARSLPVDMPLLQIVGDKGEVTVRRVEGSQSRVTATPKRWGEGGCTLDFSGDASQATAQALPTAEANMMESCETAWLVELAGDTRVDINLARGKVTLEDAPARVDVELGSGKLVLVDTQGRVDASLGRGKIKGEHQGEGALAVGVGRIKLESLEQPISARVELGSVKLAWSEVPQGTVVAHAGIGRVRTALPYGATADMADFDRRLASFRTAIPHRNSADTRLEGGARLGATRVKTVIEHDEPEAQDVVVSAE
ncbi:MAG: hypothetical protein VX899_06720 [Myxococcota bacterium]|nr:hypothetical protein [Myxococcota bacterium]